MIRVVIVDDSRPQRAGWALVIGSQPDLQVVGEARDGALALRMLRKEAADVALVDIRMPGIDGFVTAERIRTDQKVLSIGPAPRVILMASLDLDEQVPPAAEAGAYAVLYKDVEPEALLAAIRDAAAARAGR